MTTATTILNHSYRGWTIAEDDERVGELICYPREQGISHDYDYTGDGHRYCGNCLWFNDLAEAEAGIDDRIIEDLEYKLKIAVQCIEANKEEFVYRTSEPNISGERHGVFTHHIQLCDNALKAIRE